MSHDEPDWMADVEPGTIQLNVLDQDRWWVDTEGTPHLLVCMSREHLGAVIDALVFNAPGMWQVVFGVAMRDAIRRATGSAREAAALMGVILDVMGTAEQSHDWLESTVLMQRLRELTAEGRSAVAAG